MANELSSWNLSNLFLRCLKHVRPDQLEELIMEMSFDSRIKYLFLHDKVQRPNMIEILSSYE